MLFDNNFLYDLKETQILKENDLSIINSIISSGKKGIIDTKIKANNIYLDNENNKKRNF